MLSKQAEVTSRCRLLARQILTVFACRRAGAIGQARPPVQRSAERCWARCCWAASVLKGRRRRCAWLSLPLFSRDPCVTLRALWTRGRCCAALGRLVPCTQVSFQGNGPLANLQAIADASGLVKGKVGNPQADPPLRPDGKLDVGAAVGRGVDSAKIKSLLAGGLDMAFRRRDLQVLACGSRLYHLWFAELACRPGRARSKEGSDLFGHRGR